MDWFLYDNGLRHERVKIILLKRKTFSLILVLEKTFCQLKLLIARLIRSTFASLECQTSLKYGGE